MLFGPLVVDFKFVSISICLLHQEKYEKYSQRRRTSGPQSVLIVAVEDKPPLASSMPDAEANIPN
jgi:hypothetical protein